MAVNILIRDVPDEIRDSLAAMAKDQGQSMQVFLQDMLASRARLSRNMELIDAVRATIDRSRVEPMDPDVTVADIVREQRQERSENQMRVFDEWRAEHDRR